MKTVKIDEVLYDFYHRSRYNKMINGLRRDYSTTFILNDWTYISPTHPSMDRLDNLTFIFQWAFKLKRYE